MKTTTNKWSAQSQCRAHTHTRMGKNKTKNRKTAWRLLVQEEVSASTLLFLILCGVELVDAWAVVGWIAAERNVHALQELVHAAQQWLWSGECDKETKKNE